VDVLTSRNDSARTGTNLRESQLTTANVNPRQFGRLFHYDVEGNIYAQPLVVSDLLVGGVRRNVVYVATTDDVVYAFNADSNADNGGLLWRRRLAGKPFAIPVDDDLFFLSSGDATPIPANDRAISVYHSTYGRHVSLYVDNAGIVGTPVIDRARSILYLVARTKRGQTYTQTLHALDLTDGHDRVPPVVIATGSAVCGGGPDDPKNPLPIPCSFAAIENQRAGLALAGNRVVVAWGNGPLEGWPVMIDHQSRSFIASGYVMAFDADTLREAGCLTMATQSDGGNGIWQSGRAPVVDADGHVYFFTGNGGAPSLWPNRCDRDGVFPPKTTDLDNALLELDVRDGIFIVDKAYTPEEDRAALNDCDIDLGSSGPLLIPGTTTLLGGGKQGFLHVFGRDVFGRHYQNVFNIQIYGRDERDKEVYYDSNHHCITQGNHHIMGGLAYWKSASRGPLVYVSAESVAIKSYALDLNALVLAPRQASPEVVWGHPAASLSLSANGGAPGSGVLWAAHADRRAEPARHDDVFYLKAPGVLRAYDAEDLSRELWNSNLCAEDQLGLLAKFTPPTVANGKVYMATFSGRLAVYGLLPAARSCGR
jgi:outer membrane protein assembly factor BamB